MESLEALNFLYVVKIKPKRLQIKQVLNSWNFIDVVISCIILKVPNFNTFK